MPSYPANGNDAFSRLRGKLAWPVSGRLVTHFGDTRAGGIKWDGVRIATERGAAGARGLRRPRHLCRLARRAWDCSPSSTTATAT